MHPTVRLLELGDLGQRFSNFNVCANHLSIMAVQFSSSGFCVSTKLPGDTGTAGPGTTL